LSLWQGLENCFKVKWLHRLPMSIKPDAYGDHSVVVEFSPLANNQPLCQLLVLVYSMSLLPRNGIICHSLFVALPSKSGSKLTVSPWLSRIWKFKCSFMWWLAIHASDSHFGVTLHYALHIWLIIITIMSPFCCIYHVERFYDAT